MPGFLGEISFNQVAMKFGEFNKRELIIESIKDRNYYLERQTVSKFYNDKIFKESKEVIIIIEGVILNSINLIDKYNRKDFFDTVYEMYLKNGETFFDEFRGSFSGLLYDKKEKKWIVYTNHIGDKQVFYSEIESGFIFGSEITYLTQYMKNNKIEYSLDKDAAYLLLTYGFMLEDYTLFRQIKKLNAGHYMRIQNNTMEVIQYYKIDNTPNFDHTEEEIINNIDRLFRKAISLEYKKDQEYGYKHLTSLSGGLDSRMATWVAYEMGYTNILNYTFSQSNYLDETIAKQIAIDLGHEFVFKALDNGNYLKNVDEMLNVTFGNVLYSGNAHGKSFIDLVNLKDYGIVHTGQIGDVILGTFYSSLKESEKFSHGDGAYSLKLIQRVKSVNLKKHYENEEVFKFYNRAFTGTMQGNLVMQEYTEAISPFLDVDFLNYCLTIPLKYRYNHYIYIEWIKRKYPEAAKYKWEKINAKITDKKVNILGKSVPVKQVIPKVLNKILKNSPKLSMNPFDYWYSTNEELKEYLDSYYKLNIDRLNFDVGLKEDCINLFEKGDTGEKTQVLTLLSVIKHYF